MQEGLRAIVASPTSKLFLFIPRPLGIISRRPAAVPSGAAQEARYPAGTLGDIQAVASTV